MSEESGRSGGVVRLARVALVAAATVVVLAIIACAALLVAILLRPQNWAVFFHVPEGYTAWFCLIATVVCALAILAKAVCLLWLFVLCGLVRTWALAAEAAVTAASRIRSVEALLEGQAAATEKLVDLAALTDQAKGLIYRDREVEAFREIIQADLTRQDYASVERHIEAVEKRFGYGEEAARLRKETEDSRKAGVEEKVEQAVRRLQDIVNTHDWDRAQREAQRIMKMFPAHAKVASLPQRIEHARLQTKRALLQRYSEAVQKKDVETGVTLLKELDGYLAPQEAAALAESARGVFHAKLVNLGVQFSIGVADQRWDAALATGEEIIREFPNSRMAQQVREKMDLLRQRVAASKQNRAT